MESKIVKEIVEEYELKDEAEIKLSSLLTISKRKGIDIKDLFQILGVYKVGEPINMKRALAKKTHMVHIYAEEDYQRIAEEIKVNFLTKKSITYCQFMKLQKKYKITARKIKEILEINNREYKRLYAKEQKANLYLKQEELPKEFFQIREELKYFDKITLKQLEKVKEKYAKSYRELRQILEVEKVTYSEFIHKKIQTLKINLLSNQEKIQLKEKILQMCEGKDYLTKKEIEEIQQKTRASNCILKQVLSINSQNYNWLMKERIQKTRIIFSDANRKAFLLKMDCMYYDTKKFHTKKELIRKTQKIGISLETFIKNLHTNVKRYSYNLLALEKNKKGIYIGKEHPMSNRYIEEKQEKIRKIINLKFWQYYSMYPFECDKENIKEEVFFKIVEKGGILEKNFSFDEDLLLSLITNKIKYFIWNECRKVQREHAYMNQYEHELIRIQSIGDNKMTECNGIIQLFQDKVYLCIIRYVQKYQDVIQLDRQIGYELIARKMQVKSEFLRQMLEEIQKSILEKNGAKRCKNGTIIIMTEKTLF